MLCFIRRAHTSILMASALILCLFVVPCAMVNGQDTQPPIKVVHEPIPPSSVPPLGSLMQIKVELLNTTDITTKIRLIGAKDGRFIDVNFPRGALNNRDKPVFTVELPAPVAAMSYQFVIHQPSGSLTTSGKYILKRSCIQNFRVAPPEAGSTVAYQQEVATLVAKAKNLEREAISLEASFKLLEELQTSVTQ
jgi:hypothetical protein